MNELIRIESYPWFEVLKGYIDKGFTKHISPDYFYDALVTLNNVDQVQFTQMVSSLWNSYRNEQNYLLWLNTINEFFLHIEIHSSDIWNKISSLYEETYFALIQGQYMQTITRYHSKSVSKLVKGSQSVLCCISISSCISVG